MSIILIVLLASAVAAEMADDPSSRQLIDFKEKTQGPIGVLKTSYGMPVERKQANSSLKCNFIVNDYFLETLTHLSRERIPERIVHALGSGAMGYFEVTHDLTHICKAKLFSKIGKRTPVTVRLSVADAGLGGTDTIRDLRGFAVKFYTEDGNFDLVGLNTPVFSIKDPVFFTSITRALKPNPATNMRDPNMQWDFITLRPETMHLFMYIFSDLGIPDGYRHMPGYGIHAFEVVNEQGDKYFVKFHVLPDAGIKNIPSAKAQKIAGIDPAYANRDLYNAIASGNFPSWTLAVQIISKKDMKKYKVNMFDVTRLWPVSEHPLHEVGKIVLNKNPTNHFAQVEQLALNPVHLVPGINGGVGEIYDARRISYRDTQYHRLGANFNNIAINCPLSKRVYTYNRDGSPPLNGNNKDNPNYYPNSFNGAAPYIDDTETRITKVCLDDAPDNIDQIRDMYNNMSEGERGRLVENIVESLGQTVNYLQKRAIKLFTLINPDFGDKVYNGLQANSTNLLQRIWMY